MPETELIKRLHQKDEEAFRIIFDENKKKVINACYRLVYDKDAAEDLTQEVFVKVFTSIDQFKGNSKLSTWIYRIAITKSLDYLRAQKRKKRFSFIRTESDGNEVQLEIKAPESQSPAQITELKERSKLLKEALDTLAENQRVAISLSKYEGMSTKEIAEILETTVPAVESLIHRAKRNLEKKLSAYFENKL
ncbi:MAG: sigma-70 family RNA polymerase sigma factor [Ignavibacteriaceae bacterium]|nr:sigma-70 family RNA polymerase sigma factor [Ignavibacteriaceae bacterium]